MKNADDVKLTVRPSKIHGLGLFAGQSIPWGKRLIEFKGERVSKREAMRRERFYNSIGYLCMLELGDGEFIDGTVGGNESRFINSSATPNVGAVREGDGIFFYSLNDIEKGEELTFDYGFDPKKQ
jgi:SET domain-containing protein